MTFEQLIEEKRQCIEQIIADLSRKHLLALSETDEFRKVVERALQRQGYELLRAFDGRSTWETYLHTVLTREFFAFQAAMWGEWRPTAAAMRVGPVAMLLEELVRRDRFNVADAIEWMRTSHRVDQPRHKLRELAGELGLAPTDHPSSVEAVRTRPAEREIADPALSAALREALAVLSPEDRLILELRFRDHQPITRIARMLKVDARPLQRRVDDIEKVIRDSLVTQGVGVAEIEEMLQSGDSDAAAGSHKWWHFVFASPSSKP